MMIYSVIVFITTLSCCTAVLQNINGHCRHISCPRLSCNNPIPANLKLGNCCPRCPSNCGDCPPPTCPNPIPPAPGECCSRCIEDCRVILCVRPNCNNPITPIGRCCPICPSSTIPPLTTTPTTPPISVTPSGECPVKGQEFRLCASACEATCETPNPICIQVCQAKCTCVNNTVVDRRVNRCVTSDQCGNCENGITPVQCFTNPCDFTSCNNFPEAECIFDNCGGCFARFFVGLDEVTDRCDSTGTNQQCSIEGQQFQRCRTCARTCEEPDVACAAVCVPGCGCPFGQLIDTQANKCVQPDQCTVSASESCPIEGQEYFTCKPCVITCRNFSELLPCPAICQLGCGCPRGTVLDEINNKCVTSDQCSKCPFGLTPLCDVPICSVPLLPPTDPCRGCPFCPDSTNKCSLPSDSGPCEAAITRYFFNGRTCTTFVYGGCGGNANNFQTLLQCQRECQHSQNKCQLPQQRGPCRALIPRYFYDSNDQTCKRFFYGGCLGNANNFQSLTKCQNDCKPSDTDDKCLLPSDSGRCLAFIRRYFYDSSINRCKEFIYGGCEGNANNFLTLRDCQRECANTSPTNICLLPRVAGPCYAYFPRYFYNSLTKRCERFIYGGCRGNANNFVTIQQCQRQCSSEIHTSTYPVCSPEYCTGYPNKICTLPNNTPVRQRQCDITVCHACYHSNSPLPIPRLHRRCPQIIWNFGRDARCDNTSFLRKWGYCVYKAYHRYRYTQLYEDETFRCWSPPFLYNHN